MTVLRLEAIMRADLDRAVACLDAATLTRRADGTYLEILDTDGPVALRALALAGVKATRTALEVALPPSALPAIGRDLDPLPRGAVACDVVHVRRLSLGDATRELLRRRTGLGRRDSAAREHARVLLRSEDTLLAWSRRAWATRDALRAPRVRRCLRPVVFDLAALARADLDGRVLASAGALTRWSFA